MLELAIIGAINESNLRIPVICPIPSVIVVYDISEPPKALDPRSIERLSRPVDCLDLRPAERKESQPRK